MKTDLNQTLENDSEIIDLILKQYRDDSGNLQYSIREVTTQLLEDFLPDLNKAKISNIKKILQYATLKQLEKISAKECTINKLYHELHFSKLKKSELWLKAIEIEIITSLKELGNDQENNKEPLKALNQVLKIVLFGLHNGLLSAAQVRKLLYRINHHLLSKLHNDAKKEAFNIIKRGLKPYIQYIQNSDKIQKLYLYSE